MTEIDKCIQRGQVLDTTRRNGIFILSLERGRAKISKSCITKAEGKTIQEAIANLEKKIKEWNDL